MDYADAVEKNPSAVNAFHPWLILDFEIHLLGHKGVDAAFDFVEACPSAGPFIFAVAGAARAGLAANGAKSTVV